MMLDLEDKDPLYDDIMRTTASRIYFPSAIPVDAVGFGGSGGEADGEHFVHRRKFRLAGEYAALEMTVKFYVWRYYYDR